MPNLANFKERIGYGIRPNLFRIEIPDIAAAIGAFTSSSDNSGRISFLGRSASLPSSSIGTVEVPYRGRVIKLPGDRTFESWTITIFADPSLNTRSFLEKWMDKLNEHRSGGGYTGGTSANEFTKNIAIHQLQRGTNIAGAGDNDPHTIIKTYRFINAWPSNLSAIDVSYDNNNSIAEYTCEWQYDWWEAETGDNRAGNGTIT